MMSRLRKGVSAGLVILAVPLVLAAFTAVPAAAHTGLVGRSPTDGARLTGGPGELSFAFDQSLQTVPGWDAIVITGPDGKEWPAGSVRVVGSRLTATAGSLGPSGRYDISYRVVSGDGHPVAGHITVVLGRAGAGAPPWTPAGSASIRRGRMRWSIPPEVRRRHPRTPYRVGWIG